MTATIDRFLMEVEGEDVAFLRDDESDRFPVVCCGMANGEGGWIVLGASCENEELTIEGVADIAQMERQLRLRMRDPQEISFDPVLSFHPLVSVDKKLLAARVEPAEWWRRPVYTGGDCVTGSCRRVEGVDVISGRDVRFRLALDALETLRDDIPVPGLSISDLDAEDVASFREAVLKKRPEWGSLPESEFLKRAQVLDDSGEVTRAGQLLLGKKNGDELKNNNELKKKAPVRITLKSANEAEHEEEEEFFETSNLWRACRELLPRLCDSLSKPCEEAVRECFFNALIHAEHDAGGIEAKRDVSRIVIASPGLSRSHGRDGIECRNYRLLCMMKLAGLARGEGRGLKIIRAFDGMFRLRSDVLELRTVAELPLEMGPLALLPAAAPEETPDVSTNVSEKPVLGWMPILEKEQGRSLVEASRETLLIPDLLRVPDYGPQALVAASEEEEESEEEKSEGKNFVKDASIIVPAPAEPVAVEVPEEKSAKAEAEPVGTEECVSFDTKETVKSETPEAKTPQTPETSAGEEEKQKSVPAETPPLEIIEEKQEEPLLSIPESIPEEELPRPPEKVPVFGDAAHDLEEYISSLKNDPKKLAEINGFTHGTQAEEKEPEEPEAPAKAEKTEKIEEPAETAETEETAEAEAPEETETVKVQETETPDKTDPEEPASEEKSPVEETPPEKESDSEAEYSPLVNMVRSTPRLPPAIVRDAIVELCSEYRGLKELSSLLSRSQCSLRRHYLTAMLRDGVLEAELPDKLGSPDQRYRVPSAKNQVQ
ncbi:MAG: hypothetical protein LBR61_01365 [Synergistaceae bacterium]|jgi:hypothetical protein|nr:hypothetical protein [Synergistaceae bacterium]